MYISSWIGGKDSCFACYKALQTGYKGRIEITEKVIIRRNGYWFLDKDFRVANA